MTVVVTGLGAVTALGIDLPSSWAAVVQGRSAVRVEDDPDPRLRRPVPLARSPFDPAAHLSASQARRFSRGTAMALVAARAACQQAGLSGPLGRRAAVLTGRAVGGEEVRERGYTEVNHAPQPRIHPLAVPSIMPSAGCAAISAEFGVRGPSYNVTSACSSSANAIAHGVQLLRSRTVDVVLVGAGEHPLNVGHVLGWIATRAMARDTCRPFSRDRQGMVLGEGAAILALERAESAAARGATPLAQVAGFGISTGSSHLTRLDRSSAAESMRAALDDAGIAAADVGYINAHGSGTRDNDSSESAAIRDVFPQPPPTSASKSLLGHTLGASGALEAALCVQTLQTGLLPPTANYLGPDPDCLLDVVPGVARPLPVDTVLSNSFGFGGANTTLVFRRC